MPGLTLNANGTNRIFRPDGKVAVAGADGTETEHGTWASVLSPSVNRIRYQFDEEDEAEFDVNYSFNENNQLIGVVPAAANGGADSEPFVFPGGIDIDDNKDITYSVVDKEGAKKGAVIIVHGTLSFASSLDKLTIELAGGGTAEILGNEAAKPGASDIPGADRDTLNFEATTANTIEGIDIDVPVTILLLGQWDVNKEGLVFRASAQNGAISVQFGASYKGVSAGLAYYAKDGDQQVAFFIKGEHTFKGGQGQANWEVSLGHSAARTEASASLNVKRTVGDRTLSLDGSFHFIKAGSNQSVELSLAAKYEIENGELVFKADVSNEGGQLEYNLKLEGKYQFKNGKVAFVVEVGNEGGEQTAKIDLSIEFGNDRARGSLHVIVQRTPSGTTAMINFQIRVRWLNGRLVPVGDAEALPEGAEV